MTQARYKKAIRDAINDNTEPASIKNLRYTAWLIFISLIVIACIQYFVTSDQFDSISKKINSIDNSWQRLTYVQQIGTHVRTLLQINNGSHELYTT